MDNSKNNNTWSFYMVIALVMVLSIIIAIILFPEKKATNPYIYSDLINDIKQGNIKKIKISTNAEIQGVGKVTVYFPKGERKIIDILSMESFNLMLLEYQDKYKFDIVNVTPPRISLLIQIFMSIIFVILAIIFMSVIIGKFQSGSGGSKVMNFGKSKAKLYIDNKKNINFSHVAGLDEEKKEVEELVDFLKDPKKYIDIGARIPKGVLLVGPPGTGKTLLAKAVAGEAGVPFLSISGSDFVEMFVGVGASRVRDLFEQAKKNIPCIVFIDEIDAVGRKRGGGIGGGNDEREQTLNQLLVEMDGFSINNGIIIIAATNRADILDPALLRPGRFDRQIVVGYPDVKGRKEILQVHSKGKILDDSVDLQVVAQTTSGFTGADLENLLNEAALLSARNNKKEIDMEELRKAFIKIGIGTEKKSKVIPEKERRITAYHEAGHAILHEVLEELDKVHIISIIPTGRAGGYTMPIPTEDKSYLSKKRMEEEIIALFGGRVAEELVIKDITTGASNDIERATDIARSMVTKYGMSNNLGPIKYGEDSNNFWMQDYNNRNYGENIASVIDEEIKNIITTSYKKAVSIITEYIDILHRCASILMEKEKITGKEFRDLFPSGILNNKDDDKDKEIMFNNNDIL